MCYTRLNMENKNKGHAVRKTVITLIIIAVVIAIPATFFLHLKKQMQWSPVSDLSESKRTRYASLCMIPGFEKDIDKVYIRGLRDADYRIETRSYPSAEELYKIMPFEDESARKEAVDALAETQIDTPDHLGTGAASKVFLANILPLVTTDKSGKPTIESYNRHEYYVVCEDGTYRFVFIVHMM